MAIKLQERSTISAPATASDLRPTVLVFDSGVGGLSVYDEVRQLLPGLHYLYAFDNAGFPYGEKSEEYIVERVVAVVEAIVQRVPLALVVIACNSASTVSLPALRQRFEFPVVGVVPAIKPAARLTRNGVVGLLATRGTVKRPYTHELVAQFARECKIEMLGSAELVELAEAKLHGETVSLDDVRRAVQPWLRMKEPPDTVVLGCTRLVDSGAAIARRTAWLLEHEAPQARSSGQNVAFCTRMDDEVVQLSPVLQRYGFPLLEKLAI